MLVDTHCHVFWEYYEDLEQVITRAKDKGVGALIVNGYDMSSNKEVLELVKKYDIVYGALGIQPENLDELSDENISFIEEHINDDKIVAVGEIGLDYHYDLDKERQKDLFKRQLDIARKYNKPVIVHSRDCIQETYDILKMYNIKGIMHCYSGSVEMAKKFVEIGFFLGIGGISTFKNYRKVVEVIKNIPIEYILLETDCPYLTPEPYRGKRNEPAYIPLILERICSLKSLNYKDAEEVMTSSILRLFDKKIKL